MKVVVTGGCGFLGSHVCELFASRGWDVLAFDNLTKFEYNRAGFNDAIRSYNQNFLKSIGIPLVVADIRDEDAVEKACADNTDYIINCAAQPAMTIAIEDPKLDFDVNVRGTLNLINAAFVRNIPIANCSTIHVYGNGINMSLIENPTRFIHDTVEEIDEHAQLLTGKLSPLHASKRTIEIYSQAYADTYNLKAACFRLTGIYGPRQFGGEDHGWVANFAIRTLLNRPIKIFGTDLQVRDILYVKDAAQAFLDWYDNCCPAGTYNVGGGQSTAISIQELLGYLTSITGKTSPVELLQARHGDLWWFVTDAQKARLNFDWQPEVLPTEGVQALVNWIQQEKHLFE